MPRLPSIRQLKQDLRQELWREAIDEVVKCRQDKPAQEDPGSLDSVTLSNW
jgi:hypothetical protein